VIHARAAAARTTPYEWYESQIARCIPDGSLVLGLQHYWLGLRQFPFRTWLVPASHANPLYHAPIRFDRAIEMVDPDIVLVDRFMQSLFDAAESPDAPYHHLRVGVEVFMARRHAEPLCVVRDRTYGVMQVYRTREIMRMAQ
jgi:hypothetical protein